MPKEVAKYIVVPFIQYMQNFDIKVSDLSGNLIKVFSIDASDINILNASGQYKDGSYYLCTAKHLYICPGEPADGTYKIIKLNLQTGTYEIIPVQTQKLLGNSFIKNIMPNLCNSQY